MRLPVSIVPNSVPIVFTFSLNRIAQTMHDITDLFAISNAASCLEVAADVHTVFLVLPTHSAAVSQQQWLQIGGRAIFRAL